VQPTNTQVERSLAALRHKAPAEDDHVPASDDELRTTDLPDGLIERIQQTPGVRLDRLAEARERMAAGDGPTADDLADRMVGRLVCDRLR
jgi:hypothetical protein